LAQVPASPAGSVAADAADYPGVSVGRVQLPVGPTVLTVRPEQLVWDYVLGKIEKIQLDRLIEEV
jgi:hypothetical protein